jgi:hypothetical protein
MRSALGASGDEPRCCAPLKRARSAAHLFVYRAALVCVLRRRRLCVLRVDRGLERPFERAALVVVLRVAL